MHRHRCSTTAGVALLLTLLILLSGGLSGCGDDGGGPEPTPNQAPTASVNFTAGLKAVVEGEAIDVAVTAADADFDALTYSWSVEPANGGTFDDPTAASTTWTPGAARGEVTLSCTVSDGQAQTTGSTAAGSVVIGTAVAAGNLAANTTWTAANSPYVILSDVVVPVGITLDVEAGTTVYLRPSLNLGSWSRPTLEVRGTLNANGTGTVAESQVRFEGGRSADGPTGGQHRGVVFEAGAQGSLTYARVREATTGLSHLSSNPLLVDRVTLSDNGVAFAASGGAVAELVDCDVHDNGSGIQISGSEVTIRSSVSVGASRIRNNLGAGLSIGSPVSQVSTVTVVGTSFSANESGHVRVDGAFGLLSLDMSCSSLGTVPDDGPRIVVVDCVNTSLSLTGNYWGGSIADSGGILALFDNGTDCNADVANWQSGTGDWYDAFSELQGCLEAASSR